MSRRQASESDHRGDQAEPRPGQFSYEGLDRVMHEKARLGILASLAAHAGGLLFTDLKQMCSLTDGNLSRHLVVLNEAGLVEVWKGARGRRPQTMYRLTPGGRERFGEYLAVLEQVVADAQAKARPDTGEERGRRASRAGRMPKRSRPPKARPRRRWRVRGGLFVSEADGQPLHLGIDDGQLRILGGPSLAAISDNRFRNPEGRLSFRSGDEFELHFISADELELKSMEGETTRYRRAVPFAPTADDLEAFAGRYESDEMRANLDLAPGERGLMFRLNGSQPFEFAPIDRDTFQPGRMTVRLRRDADGNVVGLDYSNPVLRNITFTRKSDQG